MLQTHEIGTAETEVSPSPVLLRAEGLRMSFGGQVVLDDVDMELRKGEVVLLRGENGSGKTTLINILTGNMEPDAGSIHYLANGTPRNYRFPRRWWQELNPFDHFAPEFVAREGVGRNWQDVRLFGSQSLRANICVADADNPGENPLHALFIPGSVSHCEQDISRKADAILARLGLAGREESSADMVSLGQSKRVAIARAVAAGAKILFLDEPLAGLDRQGIADVLALLGWLVNDHNVTLVIVEHIVNQHHLQGLVTTDWLLANGTIKRGNGDSIGSDPSRPLLTPSLVSPIQRPAWFELLAGENREVVDEPLPRGALLTRIRRPGVFKNPPKPVLEIRDLIVKRGSRTIIGIDELGNQAGFSLILYEGETTILHAPNGWGKSTLFAALCGLIKINQGEILLQGQRIDGLPAWDRARKGLCALPSDYHSFPNLRAWEVLKLSGCQNTASDLGPLADRLGSALSGGERQRVSLQAQRESAHCPIVRMLDEPFAALDETHSIRTISELSKSCCINDFIFLPFVPSQMTQDVEHICEKNAHQQHENDY